MSRHRLFTLIALFAIALAACSGATPTIVSVPTATNVPTAAPTATVLQAATSAAAPTGTALPAPTAAVIATAAAHDLVPAGQLNPKTQARLRLGYYVADGPNVDLIVNNAIAVNGDQPQINIPANYAPSYLYLPPGTYSVAVVPTGQGIAQALLPPVEVPVVAGHRYTLAIMGLVGDKSLKPLLIDETAAALKAGALPTDSVRIWIDNMAGGTAIDVSGGGNAGHTQVAYGDSTAVVYPVGNFPFVVKLAGPDSAYPSYDDPSNAPGTTNMVAFVGAWGNRADAISGPPVSELSILDYLQGFSGKKINVEGPTSFDILLGAIKTAGLEEMFTTGGPYWFLAPTDAAFKALPDAQRAALLADPKALGDLIRNLLVAAYVPRGALAKTPGGAFVRTLTNLLGAPLTVGDSFSVNGVSVGGNSVFLADGSQVHPISQMLLPPSVVALALPTPTPAATGSAVSDATGRIAYAQNTDGDGDQFQEIWVMNADGSGKTRLTNNSYYDGEPAWSPDGSKILYASGRDGNTTIFVMNANGSGQTNLTHSSAMEDTPAWSPDGKKILFNSNRDGNQEIYVMNADGSGQTRLTNDPALDEFPNWSPDGKKIIFDSNRSGNAEVYEMKVDGSGLVDLTNSSGNDGSPVWSPDGQHIAFASDRDGNPETYVMDADGGNQVDVSKNPAADGKTSWSPDGKFITFDTDRDGNPQVYIMHADGSGQTALTDGAKGGFWPSWTAGAPTGAVSTAGRIAYAENTGGSADSFSEIWILNADGSGKTRLTNNTYFDSEPALSTDGTKLAFTSSPNGNTEIFAMAADGSHPVDLTNNPARDGAAAWSPDGKKIVFVSDRDGHGEIYVMNADGSGQTRLTTDSAGGGDPNWSPDGKQIVFLSRRDGNDDIFVMNADGSGQKNLTQDTVNDGGPAWSPDGKKIAFDTDRNGGAYDIYVMNTDGSDQTRLTTDPANDYWVTWSPDGTAIVFTAERDGSPQVYVMNADGSGQTRLTNSKNNAQWPSWAR